MLGGCNWNIGECTFVHLTFQATKIAENDKDVAINFAIPSFLLRVISGYISSLKNSFEPFEPIVLSCR